MLGKQQKHTAGDDGVAMTNEFGVGWERICGMINEVCVHWQVVWPNINGSVEGSTSC